ncbi:MAG: carboxypeptidase-like regulatory domain-containing protein, partial [candidate division KSB1 bacterium]|nr:carboxypeptidase-like regulatory domain-containing protein [candidate division KSB1 bacterium]
MKQTSAIGKWPQITCLWRAILGVVVFGALSAQVWSGTTGKIAGEVKDKDTGEPLPGVNVVVEGTTLGAATDASGRYYILLVPPGNYTVVASIIGYQTVRVSNVKVSVDLTTPVNFELSSKTVELGAAVEIVA